jgi:primary-amine oxidase
VNRIETAGGPASEFERHRSIEQKDVVLWYNMIVSHTPRPEDWPVMPVVRAGFRIEACGFFRRSPALDVPASP